MGHDTYAYLDGRSRKKSQIAHMRRGACEIASTTIYLVLDAREYYAGVSGNGESRFFSRGEIINALKFVLCLKGNRTIEREFLEKILSACPERGCWIRFA